MKDFISKVTFGFLMAQLFPGALVVFAITCALSPDAYKSGESCRQIIMDVGSAWFVNNFKAASFLLVSIAIGMCIHGVNWAVLAWLEHVQEKKHWGTLRNELYWHKLPVWLQLLISPLAMIIEALWLLTAGNLDCLIMNENVSRINSNKMPQFTFLQDFYLYFGQFYAHMAYALLITTICIMICCIGNFGVSRLGIVVLSYFFTSIFFLLGRIQLGSLFWAEEQLLNELKHPE